MDDSRSLQPELLRWSERNAAVMTVVALAAAAGSPLWLLSASGALSFVLLTYCCRQRWTPAGRFGPANAVTLDLFDEVALFLETANQGQTWFIKEPRLLTRHAGLGRDYETLRHASALATYIARNPVPEESRERIYQLLRDALAAFATAARPDIVYFKSLYRLARDEGHPVKQQWFPTLPPADRTEVATLLNQPVAAPTTDTATVERLQKRLADYLREHTEILP